MFRTDICIAGAGVIGLSLALELRDRGLHVTVLEAGIPMREASSAAAGMLAADDPHNPIELSALSHLSISLYPAFLERIAQLSGKPVPFQTLNTLQSYDSHSANQDAQVPSGHLSSFGLKRTVDDETSTPAGFSLLREHSIDPRQLASSLLAAVQATTVKILTGQSVVSTQQEIDGVKIVSPTQIIEATHFIDCTGAWANDPTYTVVPIKGQMLAVALPEDFQLKMTVRTEDVYIVPRTIGPNAGRAIIGATVEDVGFDKTVHRAQIRALHQRASELLPPLAAATVLETWAGLRPAAPDRLPLLGAHPSKPRHWVATGHYRNGILLAPATARIVSDLLLGEKTSVSIESFSPSRVALRQTVWLE